MPADSLSPRIAAMGLNERRKIRELQDTTFPERVREIEEICGSDSEIRDVLVKKL